jgi:hypothetical protein
MRRFTMMFCAAALFASGAAFPAFAALEPVGSVDFSVRNSHSSETAHVTGSAVALKARNSDVSCENVTARFGKGRTQEIFSGDLPRGRAVTVDLPGNQQMLTRLNFNCRPLKGANAQVDVAVDTGRNCGQENAYRRENSFSCMMPGFGQPIG